MVRQPFVHRLMVHLIADECRGQRRAHQDEVLAPGHVAVAEPRRRGHFLTERMAGVRKAGTGEEFGRVPIGDLAFTGQAQLSVDGL